MADKYELNPVYLGGYFTTQGYLQRQTLKEIENRIGLDSGRLAQGAWFATVLSLPCINDFQLAGYSQVADHRTKEQYGNLNNPGDKHEAQAYLQRKRNAMSVWSMSGEGRLIKVIPMTGHSPDLCNDFQYPPGSGIPQWKLTTKIYWKGICYVGNYPKGCFFPK